MLFQLFLIDIPNFWNKLSNHEIKIVVKKCNEEHAVLTKI